MHDKLLLVVPFLIFGLTASNVGAADIERERRKNILKIIKKDEVLKSWRNACKKTKQYEFHDLQPTDASFTAKMPTKALTDLNIYFDLCRQKATEYKRHFKVSVLDVEEFAVKPDELECVNAAFDKVEADYSKISSKVSHLFLRLNGLEMNPVPQDEWRATKGAGWRSAQIISKMIIGDDGIAEIVMDTSPQPSQTKVRLKQCFVRARSSRHTEAVRKLGLTKMPKTVIREVD